MRSFRDTAALEAYLRRAAIHYLGQRSSSVENLRQVLARKATKRAEGLESEDIERTVEAAVTFCKQNAFIDDVTYTEVKVSSGERRGLSSRKLGMMLGSKGVEQDVIEEALSEFDDSLAAVRFAKRRRLGPWRNGEAELMKDVGAFARGGFSSDIAFRTARMTIEEAEAILYGEVES